MKYIDADKIRAETERLRKEIRGYDDWTLGFESACERILNAIDIMPDEEPVSEELEEAAKKYADGPDCSWVGTTALEIAFKAGAEWQKEQFEKNRLTACDNQTKEEYDREVDFVDGIIEKEHRMPTFSDAINYGMAKQKEKMMEGAVECVVCAGMEGDKWIMTYIGSYESMLKTCKAGDKVKIIIVKEEE